MSRRVDWRDKGPGLPRPCLKSRWQARSLGSGQEPPCVNIGIWALRRHGGTVRFASRCLGGEPGHHAGCPARSNSCLARPGRISLVSCTSREVVPAFDQDLFINLGISVCLRGCVWKYEGLQCCSRLPPVPCIHPIPVKQFEVFSRVLREKHSM